MNRKLKIFSTKLIFLLLIIEIYEIAFERQPVLNQLFVDDATNKSSPIKDGPSVPVLEGSFSLEGSSRKADSTFLSAAAAAAIDSDFELARRESLDFFKDLSSGHWNLVKVKFEEMSPNFDISSIMGGQERPGLFFQNHFEPDFVCSHERRLGRAGDGGKWVCDPHRIAEQKECLIYSFGSDNDFSFEMAALKEIGPHCEIHTFDVGNYSARAMNVGARLHNGVNKMAVNYHQIGLGNDESPEFKSLRTIVKELGHENRIIDLFKIDCEGCEWESSESWFHANVMLRQILVELHESTGAPKFFDMMYDNDYVIFHKEANIAHTGPQNTCIEYSFLKLAPEFHLYNRTRAASIPYDRNIDESQKNRTLQTLDTNNTRQRKRILSPNSDVMESAYTSSLTDKVLLRNKGKEWEMVNLTDPNYNKDLGFSCDFVPFVSTLGHEAEICVHPFPDLISDEIRISKRWKDCDSLSFRWIEEKESTNAADSSDGLFVEIGGNIGSCVMEMLLSTNANILVFEPHPRNLFVLQQSMLRLGANYSNRVALVPTALGGQSAKVQLFPAKGNMGNSVIGKPIGDSESQEFEEPIVIHVERFDSILKSTVRIPLMKLDAQGFECEILNGFSPGIAANIRLIKFEMAAKWLDQQQCFDLLPRLRKFNFTITSDQGSVIATDKFSCGVCDLFARGVM